MTAKAYTGTYGTVPSEGFTRPSFWTKRKKTATSLVATLGLLAGIAIAYKLFDQTVPNNVVRDASSFDFELAKMEAGVGDTDWVPVTGTQRIFTNGATGAQYPGDTRTVNVRIRNTNAAPAKDATFYLYIDRIMVWDYNTNSNIGTTDPRWSRFVSFWTFSADKQNVLNSALLGGDLATDDPRVTYSQACSGGFREITRNSPCQLGLVRAADSKSFLGDPTDERLYKFNVAEADDGTDQSAFKNWAVWFDLVISARLPAVPENVSPIGQR